MKQNLPKNGFKNNKAQLGMVEIPIEAGIQLGPGPNGERFRGKTRIGYWDSRI